MDVDTENDIGPFVKEYGIDGRWIDIFGADLSQPYAEAAGDLRDSEVFGKDAAMISKDPSTLDSNMNFLLRKGILDALTVPVPEHSALETTIKDIWDLFNGNGLLRNFMDVSRWAVLSVGPQRL